MTDFLSLLPPNATELERALEQATGQLGEVPVAIRTYWNADLIPVDLMPWLGWEWSVDNWNPEWSESVKRNLLRDAFRHHQHKGTRQSVEDAVASLGSHIAIKEWWEHSEPATPHTFEAVLDSSSGSSTGVLQRQLIDAIDNARPVRSHYTLTVATSAAGDLNIYGYGRVGRFQRLYFRDDLIDSDTLNQFVYEDDTSRSVEALQ